VWNLLRQLVQTDECSFRWNPKKDRVLVRHPANFEEPSRERPPERAPDRQGSCETFAPASGGLHPFRANRGVLGAIKHHPLITAALTAAALTLCRGAEATPAVANGTNIGADLRALSLSPYKHAKAELSHQKIPVLLIGPATPRNMGEAAPLGISIQDAADGTLFLQIKGFASGTKLNVGFALGSTDWGLFAHELKNAQVQPPPDFVGTMDLIVDLYAADASAVDHRSLQLTWVRAGTENRLEPQARAGSGMKIQEPPQEPPPPRTGAPTESQEARRVQPETNGNSQSHEITGLVKRGEDLISRGDLAAARLLLRRAAFVGDAHAALLLATTYDPGTFDKLHVHGLLPDVAMARYWYKKAEELGSREALQRLNALATQPQ